MKRNGKDFKVKYLIMLLIVTILSSGCSVVGLGTGALIDSSKPDYKFIEKDQISTLKPGTRTILHVDERYTKEGKFVGFTVKSDENGTGGKTDTSDTAPDSSLIIRSLESMKTDIKYEYIPLQDIDYTQVKNKKNAKYIGLGVGLLIDIAIIAAIYIKSTETMKRVPYEVVTSGHGR